MSEGFYKRRRGVLEHIEAGTIDLLEDGIHDYLSLKANLIIGNGYRLPAGVVSTSAPAIHAKCKRVSKRTIQRVLNHLEEIGWLKFSPWRTPGKRGNYMVAICRASVHDLSGNEFRINGEKTTDWRHPTYELVGEVSGSRRQADGEVSGNRELENKRKRIEKKKVAQAPKEPSPSAFCGIHFSVSVRQDQILAKAFPWVDDRPAEYRKADSWLEANPNRRRRNAERFLHNWFSRISAPSPRLAEANAGQQLHHGARLSADDRAYFEEFYRKHPELKPVMEAIPAA